MNGWSATLREQCEVARRARRRLDRWTHPGSQGRSQARLETECEEQWNHTHIGPDQRSQGQQRQGRRHCGCHARPGRHRWALDLAPADQGRHVELGADVVAEQTQVLPQIDPIAKLADDGLPLANFGRARRRAKPACELVLSGRSASAAQQLPAFSGRERTAMLVWLVSAL